MNKIIEAIEFFNKVEINVKDVSTDEDKNNGQKAVIVTYKYEDKKFTTKKLYYKDISFADHVKDKQSLINHFGQPVYWLDIAIHEWPKPSGESDLNRLVVEDMYEGKNADFKQFLLKLANNSKTGYIQNITGEGRTAQYHHNLENNNHWHDLVLLIKAYINSKGKDIDEKYFASLIFKWHKGERTSLSKYFGSRKLINDLQKNIELAFKELNKMENQISHILENNKNIVLTGAPGTGKTYLAKELIAKKITDTDKIELVQFHPSYDYTDFVEGLRPTPPDKNGNIGFELKNGVFKEFCKRALNECEYKKVDEKLEYDKENSKLFVFIIDEINRAEISKVFGELFFAIEPDYRGENGKVKTQYANLQTEKTIFDDDLGKGWFYIPENVFIIGTMNDIDRSVNSFDFAMRRRFAWIEIKAKDRIEMWNSKINDDLKDTAKKKMINLNNAIYDEEEKTGIEGLSSSYHIGPAYFLKLNFYEEQPFQKLWDNHIQILLAEYLRGFPDAEDKIEYLKNEYDKE